MDLIPNDWKHIATLNWNYPKNPFKKSFCYNDKGTSKVKVFPKLSKEDILQQTIQINISSSNTMDGRKPYSQSLYWQNVFQIGLSNAIMVVFFLSGINLSIFLPLKAMQYRDLATHQIFCVPDERNKMSLTSPLHFIFYYKISKIYPD